MGCCELVDSPARDGRVLHRTDHFFVCAGLGPIKKRRGYILLVPNFHFEGSGDMPEDLQRELAELNRDARKLLRSTYGKQVMMFEHGPRVAGCGWGSASCIDHAHLHLFPGKDMTPTVAPSLFGHLTVEEDFFRVYRTEGFRLASEIYEAGRTSYMIFQPEDAKQFTTEISRPGVSQFMRQQWMLTEEASEYNWRKNPDMETVLRTVEDLAGKF